MFKKIGIGVFWVFALVFSLLNIKIYSSEVCSELNAQKIDEYANYITDRSVQNISLEEREKIKDCAYKICTAYSKLNDKKNCKLWYAHYVRLNAALHIAKATETGSLEEWRLASAGLNECIKYYSLSREYEEAKPFIPYSCGAAAKVKYQIAKILNSSDAWSNAEQSFETATNFFRAFGYTAEKNRFKFLSLLSECRGSLECCVASKRISPLSELKIILFELTERSKEIKLDSLTIKNYQSAYEIVSKICCGFQKSDRSLIHEAARLLMKFEVCVDLLPCSHVESQELFERFIVLMKPFVNRLSLCYGI